MKRVIILFSFIMFLSQFAISQISIRTESGKDTTYLIKDIDSITFKPTMRDIIFDDFTINPITNGWVYADNSGINSSIKIENGELTINTLKEGEEIIITKYLPEEIFISKENFLFEAKVHFKHITANKNYGSVEFGLMDDANQIILNFHIKWYEGFGGNSWGGGLYYSDQEIAGIQFGGDDPNGSFTCTKTNNTYLAQYNYLNDALIEKYYDRIIKKCYIKFSWIGKTDDTFPYANPYEYVDFIRVKKLP